MQLRFIAFGDFISLPPIDRMHQDDQSIKHPKSHYQLGGIHGLPNKEWNGAGPGDPNVATYQGGSYCSHGTVLFPTWHRPYVALYEVSLTQRLGIFLLAKLSLLMRQR